MSRLICILGEYGINRFSLDVAQVCITVYPCRVCGKDYPKDTVIVHGFGRGRFAPSLGHFVIKLGTYLRITKIPHEVSVSSQPHNFRGDRS